MALAASVALKAAQTWPQEDVKSPLGLWGARAQTTGDASGGSVKLSIQTPTSQRAAFVYNCEAVSIAVDVVQVVDTFLKCRLLSNWPNIDPQAGIQGFSTTRFAGMVGSANFTSPEAGEAANGATLIKPNDRYILMFDPRSVAGAFNIIELEVSENVLATNYFFEAYGYYWDRSVLQAPGGPRFPGQG